MENEMLKKLRQGEEVKATDFMRSIGVEVTEVKEAEEFIDEHIKIIKGV